jgi:hypothetical protein
MPAGRPLGLEARARTARHAGAVGNGGPCSPTMSGWHRRTPEVVSKDAGGNASAISNRLRLEKPGWSLRHFLDSPPIGGFRAIVASEHCGEIAAVAVTNYSGDVVDRAALSQQSFRVPHA